MPTYTIETPRGRKVKIEADSPETAMSGAQRWDLEDHASSEATRLGIRPDLILRQMQQESGGNPNAVSPKGARGRMQLMPGTAKDLGVNPDDPYQNITGGVTYMKRQLDAFGGDEAKALAAYNAGPGAVARAGGVPNYPETQAYVKAIQGGGQPAATTPAPAAVATPAAASMPPQRVDQGLGFAKGLGHTNERIAGGLEFLASKIGLDKPINALGESLGLPSRKEADASHAAFLANQAAKGVRAGKIGEFGGNVLGTVGIPGGPLVQGAVGGALTGDATDAKGVAGEMALGGLTGRLTAMGSDALQLGARKLLSKAPKIMDLPALEQAVKTAYAKVDASGFTIPTGDMRALANDVTSHLRTKGGPKAAKLYADSDAFAARLHALSTQKGGVSVSQLDELRSDIYDALIKPGGKEAGIGKAIRGKIDGLIDSIPNGDVKAARELYSRLSKARTVSKVLDSADLRKSAAYSGANTDNTIRQQIRPLVDPTSGKRITNATPDEQAALRKVVDGTGLQNLSRLTGQGLDPRKLLGKLSGLGALGGAGPSGGLSLLAPALGLVGTTVSNRASQKNVQNALDLILAGGSRQALAKVPTQASHAAEQVIALLRPALVASAVPALAAAKTPPRTKPNR